MRKFNVTVNGNTYEVEVEEVAADSAPAVKTEKKAEAPKAAAPAPKKATGATGAVKVTSPMPGNILSVNYKAGQAVKKGDVLCILEAMKMENEILAPSDGTVASVNCDKGSTVASGDILFTLN